MTNKKCVQQNSERAWNLIPINLNMKQSNQAAFFMSSKIALIYMGGTFGCVGEPLAPMPAADFFPQLKEILPVQNPIELVQAHEIKDSSACTARDWLLLIQKIQQLQAKQFQNFIVIHGTDTMSYAAAILSRFLHDTCRVIITGSQFPLLNHAATSLHPSSDALDNLNHAIQYMENVSDGVYLCFNHQIFHARTAVKTHRTALNAFCGEAFTNVIKPISSSFVDITEQHIERSTQLNIANLSLRPIEIKLFNQHLTRFIDNSPHVLILQAYGTGNLAINADTTDILKQLRALGCHIVLSSQVMFGELDQRYAISSWIKASDILIDDTLSDADLYAKILKMYLQYPSTDQWLQHWYDSSN